MYSLDLCENLCLISRYIYGIIKCKNLFCASGEKDCDLGGKGVWIRIKDLSKCSG